MARTYYVYILASRSRNLYTGVTNNLVRRLTEHRQGLVPGFTTRYNIFRLVHFERFGDIGRAIAREKEIKGWRREKKVWLIQRGNPLWEDLAQPQKAQPTAKATRTAEASPTAEAEPTTKADPSPPFAKSRRPGSG